MNNEEEKNTPMPEEELSAPNETPQDPPAQRYVPRPKWQIIMAWVLVAVMVVAVISYYFWIAYRYV